MLQDGSSQLVFETRVWIPAFFASFQRECALPSLSIIESIKESLKDLWECSANEKQFQSTTPGNMGWGEGQCVNFVHINFGWVLLELLWVCL